MCLHQMMGQQAPRPGRLALLAALHVGVVVLFASGFLLTRVELPDAGRCGQQGCRHHQRYSKAVILIVDALRYDFVCAPTDGQPLKPHQALFPRTLGIMEGAVSAWRHMRSRGAGTAQP